MSLGIEREQPAIRTTDERLISTNEASVFKERP